MNPEKYSPDQASAEAAAMTERLEKENPGQRNFSSNQYEAASLAESDEIYKTAFGTVRDLGQFGEIEAARRIWEELGGNTGNETFAQKTAGKPHLVEMRYKMSEKILREASEQQGVKQAIEIASGFTPHALELLGHGVLDNYIEADFPVNTMRKKEVIDRIHPDLKTNYISGNVYEEELWQQMEGKLHDGPVAIFSEGFMLYTSVEEREILGQNAKRILEKHGGFFLFEDSTRFHPEFRDLPLFRSFFEKLEKSSERGLGPISQEEIQKEWEARGFIVERIPEDATLKTEQTLAGAEEEIGLIKKNYKMWKLSLPERS